MFVRPAHRHATGLSYSPHISQPPQEGDADPTAEQSPESTVHTSTPSTPRGRAPTRATRRGRRRARATHPLPSPRSCLTPAAAGPYRAGVKARVAVLASGRGTNLQALLDDPVVGPWIALVVSDRTDTFALERARTRDVKAVVLDPAAHADRAAYDHALRELLESERIDCVALAGFMRIIGPEIVDAFRGRILNVHPALLPSFAGADAVADALAWGVKVTGVTVHLVDEEVDHGPIVAQEPVAVRTDDDWDALESRIHGAEHRLLPAAVRALVEGRIKVEGRIVHVLGEPGLG
jgi:phosphoribosylglycinamide formyltransferase-1